MQKIFGSKLTYDRSLSNIGTKLRVSLSFHFSASACSNPENRAKMRVILWSIWKSRNTKLWDNVETHPAVAFSTSMQYFSEWKHAELSSQAHTSPLYSTSGNNTTITWIPPQQNHLKCNLDASIFQKLNSLIWGIQMGVLSKRKQSLYLVCPSQKLLKFGLSNKPFSGQNNSTFELDCKLVVDDFNSCP